MDRTAVRALDRDILRLAVPALGALVAEPLFLLVDTALVGHLGGGALASVGLAATVLQTAVGLLIFLAYATTPIVARRLGAGDTPGAVSAGIDGMWLALGVGIVLALIGIPLARPVIALFGSTDAVTDGGAAFLLVSLAGLPAMLLVLAATGLLRGLQDTRTPLVVAGAGFAANAALDAVLIYPAGLGLVGSALGTVIAQWGMATVYVVIAVRAARRMRVPLRPGLRGVSASAAAGGWLLLRTASLRAALVATTAVGASLGVAALGALQVQLQLYFALALALDAFAIAGQAIIGHGLGASDPARVRAVLRRLLRFGVLTGLGLGALLALATPLLGPVFTSDTRVQALLVTTLVLAPSIPLGGVVFVLDGVLIGAGDGRYLAWTGVLNLAVYAALLAVVIGSGVADAAGLVALLAAFSFGYLGSRALTLSLRARSDAWLRLGAAR